jgi:hypothetical protein
MLMPRSCNRSSKLRSDKGNRTYIIMASRMISRARLEIRKGVTFCDPATLIAQAARLNKLSSDSAGGYAFTYEKSQTKFFPHVCR